MISKDTAYKKISALVQRFDEQSGSYKKSDYNETLTRRDFIDPFFKAFGWDMNNEEGYSEAYREVIHEERLKVGDYMKAPDYTFRLSGGYAANFHLTGKFVMTMSINTAKSDMQSFTKISGNYLRIKCYFFKNGSNF